MLNYLQRNSEERSEARRQENWVRFVEKVWRTTRLFLARKGMHPILASQDTSMCTFAIFPFFYFLFFIFMNIPLQTHIITFISCMKFLTYLVQKLVDAHKLFFIFLFILIIKNYFKYKFFYLFYKVYKLFFYIKIQYQGKLIEESL